jgi:hypothetical protein
MMDLGLPTNVSLGMGTPNPVDHQHVRAADEPKQNRKLSFLSILRFWSCGDPAAARLLTCLYVGPCRAMAAFRGTSTVIQLRSTTDRDRWGHDFYPTWKRPGCTSIFMTTRNCVPTACTRGSARLAVQLVSECKRVRCCLAQLMYNSIPLTRSRESMRG